MKKRLAALIKTAKTLGLPKIDLDTATGFLLHHEYGLCFETIATQMHENNLNIDVNTYTAITEVAKGLKINAEDYAYMKDLVIN